MVNLKPIPSKPYELSRLNNETDAKKIEKYTKIKILKLY